MPETQTETGAGLRVLVGVFGFWLLMRATNPDASGRTLIDHILGKPATSSPYLTATVTAAGTVGAAGAAAGASGAGGVAGAVGAGVAGVGGALGAGLGTGAGGSSIPSGSQQSYIAQVAKKYGVSPRTLWGIYGTESSFGTNPSTSSAGAQGPFQFLPSTWATYGGGGNIQSFHDAAIAAAKLLKASGADNSPTSSGTQRALASYYGAPSSTYYNSVLNFGNQYGGGSAPRSSRGTSGGSSGRSSSSSGGGGSFPAFFAPSSSTPAPRSSGGGGSKPKPKPKPTGVLGGNLFGIPI